MLNASHRWAVPRYFFGTGTASTLGQKYRYRGTLHHFGSIGTCKKRIKKIEQRESKIVRLKNHKTFPSFECL